MVTQPVHTVDNAKATSYATSFNKYWFVLEVFTQLSFFIILLPGSHWVGECRALRVLVLGSFCVPKP